MYAVSVPYIYAIVKAAHMNNKIAATNVIQVGTVPPTGTFVWFQEWMTLPSPFLYLHPDRLTGSKLKMKLKGCLQLPILKLDLGAVAHQVQISVPEATIWNVTQQSPNQPERKTPPPPLRRLLNPRVLFECLSLLIRKGCEAFEASQVQEGAEQPSSSTHEASAARDPGSHESLFTCRDQR